MSNLYLNENLVLDNSKDYILDKEFLMDVTYYIKKDIFAEKYNEKRSISDSKECLIRECISVFKKNFAKSRKISMDMLENREERYYSMMLGYFYRTFPYCLFEDGNIITKDLDSALLFFAKNNLNAKDECLKYIIPVLKTCHMKNMNIENKILSESIMYVSYLQMSGTTIEQYKRDNLYDCLHALEDQDLCKLLNSILVLDGLVNPENIINNNEIDLIKNGMNFCVMKGIHKMIMVRTLSEISSMVTRNCFENNPLFRNKVKQIKTP